MNIREQLISELKERQSKLMYALAEDTKIYNIEVIFHIVAELRSVTKILKMLENKE